MKSRKNYIPCLKWKQGEYQALLRLSSTTKDSILPIIEVAEFSVDEPENSFDHEEGKPPKTIDEHLSKFAKRVKEKWGTNECFVDLRHIEATSRLVDGQHPMSFIFDDLRSQGVKAIPVVGLEQDTQYRASAHEAIVVDNRGFCLRVSLQKASSPNLVEIVDNLLGEMGVGTDQCDFIFDLGAPENFEPLNVFAGILESIIKNIPYLNSWRSFGLIGTSFPSSLSGIKSGISFIPRNEWRLYKELIKNLKISNIRIPTFGDYVINHPKVSNMDMRFMKPKANVRYALSDSWLIARGENVRDYGYGQHRELCNLILKSREYSGDSFSPADKYIYDCAKGTVPTGNLSTWRWVGTNHHLEIVTRDVANLAAS